MWDERQLDGMEFIPEPTDSRIVSAADPTTVGHQEGWRGEVMGWSPEPIRVVPRRSTSGKNILNVGIMLLLVLVMWSIWRSQFLFVEVTPQQSEWAFEDSGVRSLQSLGLSGDGIRVCMVDTGIDTSHPDFNGLQLVFRDFISTGNEPVDHGGLAHGTMMAGILVSNGYLNGVAPNVILGMAAALGEDDEGENSGSEDKVADAINWCWEKFGANIISLSLGGVRDPNATMEGPSSSAVRQALNNGVFVVAAAGNDGGEDDDGRVASPSNVKEVISVAALDKDNLIWQGSSIGSGIDNSGDAEIQPHQKPEISAPGVDILSTGPGGQYFISTGTSDSTVFVAGILSLILEAEPQIANGPDMECMGLVKTALKQSAVPLLDGVAHDPYWGYGAIDGLAWLEEIQALGSCN
jgi:serine protease AprX